MAAKPPVVKSSNKSNFEKDQNPYKPTKLTGPEPQLEIIPDETFEPKPKKSKRTLKIFLIFMVVIIIGLGGFVAIRANGLLDNVFVNSNSNFYNRIADLITSQTGGSRLIGEKENQINVLLLGIGGPGHDGPYLSDTIMVAQLKPKDQKATLTSIPRDYLINTQKLGQRKINAVFAETYAETKDWEQAGKATIEVVEEISGLEIPYFAVIDFDGFEKTIDLLNGVEVTIDRTFTDYTFPNNKNGYIPAVTFREGTETMNGERALIFARSRHAAGVEGTDFARGIRQQKIIQAAKTKLVSLNFIADPGKVNEMFSIIGEHFHTNLSPGELIRLYNIGKDFNQDQITSVSLDPSTGLICPKTIESTGAFVLTVCTGRTKQDVKDFFAQSFSAGALNSEQATVWLGDSTVSQKLYKKAETDLVNNGFTVLKVLYTGTPLNQNVVYSVNQKPATVDFIKQRLSASEVSIAPPGIKIDPKKVDVIIILGE